MNKEEIKVMIKDGVYSEDGITYMSDKQYNNYINIIEQLQKENKELKLELSGYRQAILNDKAMLGLKEKNQELKKQLEEKNKPQIFIDTQDVEERYAEGLYQDYLEEENKKYKNQQKEFIEWLTNEANINPYDISDYIYEDIINTILLKYKEIIDKLEKGE